MSINTPIDAGIFSRMLFCKTPYDGKQELSDLTGSHLFELSIVTNGSGIHRVLNQEIPCKGGDVFIVPPNIPHGYFTEHKENTMTVRQLFWDLDSGFGAEISDPSNPRFCYGIFRESKTLGYAVLNEAVAGQVTRLWDMTVSEIEEAREEWQNAARALLSCLLITVSRYVNSAIKNLSFACAEEWKLVSDTIGTVREEYGDPTLTLEEVAHRLFVSKSRLGKLFVRLTGRFFSDYLRDIRLENVCKLLQKSNATVDQIAKECGFHNMPSFYKNFSAKTGVTPNEYRLSATRAGNLSQEYIKLLKGEKIVKILNDISENLQKGRSKIVKELVQQALDEGVKPADILNEGLLDGMGIIGEKFKNNEVYVPEVLVAARAMNMGTQILKPYLTAAGITSTGRVCIGTVQGDLHDIGKNLVKMMMEGKGLEVIDLGTDVSPEKFINTAIEQNCRVICCSALLTTTMPVMEEVVKAAEAAGIRNSVKIMIGGAPVSEEYRQKIGADCYTVDAASAADAAAEFCKA